MHILNTRQFSLLALVAVSITSGDALAQDGPSFNCARAKSAAEKTICGDANLATRDRQVSAIYPSRLKGVRTDIGARRTAMKRQKNFLKQRNLCGTDTACIENLYITRFFDLTNCIIITSSKEATPHSPTTRTGSAPPKIESTPLPDWKPNPPRGAMTLSGQGRTLLKDIETLRLKPYDDQSGKEINKWVEGATIGYGHLISQSDWDLYKNGITNEEAKQAFGRDLAPFIAEVNKDIKVPLKQNEFDALVVISYNIGASNFSKSSVVKLINDPKSKTSYTSLDSAWKAWNKSQGKVSFGLINRRASEWNIYSQGIYQGW